MNSKNVLYRFRMDKRFVCLFVYSRMSNFAAAITGDKVKI
jgi:hypothetical protein